MSPRAISRRVVAVRLEWVREMVAEIRRLPLDDREAFMADRRNVFAAESCLRRALEALLDLGRHVAARGFGDGVSEYKAIASSLHEHGVLDESDAALLRVLAGYRNRMVHFYEEIDDGELFEICGEHVSDLELIIGAFETWFRANPGLIDEGV